MLLPSLHPAASYRYETPDPSRGVATEWRARYTRAAARCTDSDSDAITWRDENCLQHWQSPHTFCVGCFDTAAH